MRPEPRLRRRRAARPHQLPQLRQPGEAARRLAARPLGAAGSPTPARRSRYRWSAATSRSTTRPKRGPIYPTPVVGLVGELPDASRTAGIALAEGDAIALCGPFAPSLAGSELAKLRGDLGPGLPALPVERVRAAIELVREAVRARAVGGGPRHQRRRACLRAGRVCDRGRGRARGRPRPAGRVAGLLRRERAVRRGARRLPARRRTRGSSSARRARPAEAGIDLAVIGRGWGRPARDLGRARPSSRSTWPTAERAWRSLERADGRRRLPDTRTGATSGTSGSCASGQAFSTLRRRVIGREAISRSRVAALCRGRARLRARAGARGRRRQEAPTRSTSSSSSPTTSRCAASTAR